MIAHRGCRVPTYACNPLWRAPRRRSWMIAVTWQLADEERARRLRPGGVAPAP